MESAVRAGPHSPHPRQTRPLVEVVPGFDRWLEEDQRRLMSRFQVPVVTVFEGPLDLGEALREADAFAIVIVDGMVVRTVSLAGHVGQQLLGPGDLISRSGGNGSDLVSQTGLHARSVVRFAPLDDRVLALIQRFPRLHEGWQVRGEDQQQRLLAQLLICQLPRVEDRVLALVWLLAETWGRVTMSGTVLPVRLTHDTIGQLVGARRSTVTLALSALEERGALVRRTDDWLILERPGDVVVPVSGLPGQISSAATSPWGETPAATSVATVGSR